MVRLSKKNADTEARIEAKVMARLAKMKHPLVAPAPALLVPPAAVAVEGVAAQPEQDKMQLPEGESTADEAYFEEFGILRKLRFVANSRIANLIRAMDVETRKLVVYGEYPKLDKEEARLAAFTILWNDAKEFMTESSGIPEYDPESMSRKQFWKFLVQSRKSLQTEKRRSSAEVRARDSASTTKNRREKKKAADDKRIMKAAAKQNLAQKMAAKMEQKYEELDKDMDELFAESDDSSQAVSEDD